MLKRVSYLCSTVQEVSISHFRYFYAHLIYAVYNLCSDKSRKITTSLLTEVRSSLLLTPTTTHIKYARLEQSLSPANSIRDWYLHLPSTRIYPYSKDVPYLVRKTYATAAILFGRLSFHEMLLQLDAYAQERFEGGKYVGFGKTDPRSCALSIVMAKLHLI